MLRFILSVLMLGYCCAMARSEGDALKSYTSKEGKFTILWPGQPKVTRTTHPKTGTVKTNYRAPMPGAGLKLLMVDVADLPAKEVKKNGLDGTVKVVLSGFMTQLKATILSEKKCAVGKARYPGKDVVLLLTDKSTCVRLRVCLVNDRLYVITVVGPKESVEGKMVGKLFESFTPTR